MVGLSGDHQDLTGAQPVFFFLQRQYHLLLAGKNTVELHKEMLVGTLMYLLTRHHLIPKCPDMTVHAVKGRTEFVIHKFCLCPEY